MFKWLTQLSKNKKAKKKQLWQREFSVAQDGLDEAQAVAFANDPIASRDSSTVSMLLNRQKSPPDAVHSIIERAVTDAEQLAASIKTRAQKEAEDEAARIIERAKKGADELRRQAATTQKETENFLAALTAKTRIIEEESKQKVESFLVEARQEIEKQVRDDYKEVYSRLLISLKEVKEDLPSSDAPALFQTVQTPGLTTKEPEVKLAAKEEARESTVKAFKQAEKWSKLAAKEVDKRKAEEAQTQKTPVNQQKGMLIWLSTIRIGKKTEEAPNTKETSKQARKEAGLPASAEDMKVENVNKQEVPVGKQEEKLTWQQKIGMRKKTETVNKDENNPVVRSTIEEANHPSATKALLEQKVQSDTENFVSKAAKSVQPERGAVVSRHEVEPEVNKSTEYSLSEGKSGKQEPFPTLQNLDKDTVYTGEIELVIAVPVDLAAVSKLYNYLQSTPDMKILYTRGSWDRGTTITVSIDKPLPFIGMLSKISGLTIAPGTPQKENLVKGTSSSLLGAKRKELTRIDLVLKAE